MRLIYQPAGSERQVFAFTVDDLPSQDAELLESVGGDTWGTLMEWLAMFERGSFKAWRAGLWVFVRRTQPDLTFADFTITVKELQIDMNDDDPEPEGKDGPDGGDTGSP